jgi:phospholipid-binding lipoprotein MlaA
MNLVSLLRFAPSFAALACLLAPQSARGAEGLPDTRVAGVRVTKPRTGHSRSGGYRHRSRRHHSRRKGHSLPSSAAVTPEEDEVHPQASDPLERLNRGIFKVNHQIYRFVFKPIARVTTFVVPEPVMDAVGNVFENLKSPVRISASLLQGKGQRAAQETAKMLVNSTVGIGGLWKPSDRIRKLKNVPEEDFGQTLGTWGVKSGPYLVVPVVGPRSVRDLVGMGADICAQPQTWVTAGNANVWATIADNVQRNPDRMQAYDDATNDALDPYIAMREAYTAYRRGVVER